jgi:ketosteroid isomerase-like protein
MRFMAKPSDSDSDVKAIEALNCRDTNAVMSGDIAAITAQWTDDFVNISAGGPIVRGLAANADIAERGKDQIDSMEPLEYRVDFEEITICGDYAYEWGTYGGATRLRATGQVFRYTGKLMRILQKQADGSWKMHRTMTSVDPAEGPAPMS